MNARAVSRLAVAVIAVVMTLTLVGCGSSGPSKAELAAQDRVVLATSRRQSAHARLAAAVRAKQHRARARVRAELLRRKRARQPRYRVVVPDVQVRVLTVEMTPSGVCGPIRGGDAQSRRERRQRRRQALDYLNLHC